MNRLFKCEACGERFWQVVERRSSPPPDDCPICHGSGDTSTEEALVWKSRQTREADARISTMADEGKGPGYNSNARDQLRSEDQVFRAMEAGSIFRAEAAASDLGVPVSEVSHLKITNMRDNVKPGETSAIVPLSDTGVKMREAAKQMSFAPTAPGVMPAASAYAGAGTVIHAGTPFAKQVGTMVGPNAGMHGSAVQSMLTQSHAPRAAMVAARGQLNKE